MALWFYGLLCWSSPAAGIIYASKYELDLLVFFSRNANLKCNDVGINEETERERERKAALCEACRHDASQQTQFLTSLFGSGSCLQVHKRDIDNAEHVTGGKTTLEDLGWVDSRLHRCQKS